MSAERGAEYRLEGITMRYGEQAVLQVESLEIKRGEVFALVGPSGAGKSTLLRILSFIEPPSAGRSWFGEREFSAAKEMPLEERRKVTMVFQRPMLLNASVYENVQYGLRLRGVHDRARVMAALESVGLARLARKNARALSGGEAQRVALARAIVLNPQVLLLDEPTANLDPYNVGLIEQIAGALNREQGATLVLVTHNVFQARRMAHRVGFLLDGRVIETAPTETFFSHPTDPRTGAFARGEMVY